METKIIQITAGRGPEECKWVVAKVLKVFLKEATANACAYEILQREKGVENGTLDSVLLQLSGKNLANFLSTWLGTIQWVGSSAFRKNHKRKNWFIGAFEIEERTNISVNEKDIHFQAIRSSGPGGQHVNKVSSAIRASHGETGVKVVVMDSRSQHQNKKIAIKRLQEKISEYNLNQLKQHIQSQWGNHMNLERGNPIRVFRGSDFKIKKEQKEYKTKRLTLKNDLKKRLWD